MDIFCKKKHYKKYLFLQKGHFQKRAGCWDLSPLRWRQHRSRSGKRREKKEESENRASSQQPTELDRAGRTFLVTENWTIPKDSFNNLFRPRLQATVETVNHETVSLARPGTWFFRERVSRSSASADYIGRSRFLTSTANVLRSKINIKNDKIRHASTSVETFSSAKSDLLIVIANFSNYLLSLRVWFFL